MRKQNYLIQDEQKQGGKIKKKKKKSLFYAFVFK